MQRSLKPSIWFWGAAIGLSISVVGLLYITGIAATKCGAVAADVFGMVGGLVLLFATAQSLPTRERLIRLSRLSTLPEDKFIASIQQGLMDEENAATREEIKREWHLTIIGAGFLIVSFGTSTAATLLAP